ncbi:MAG: hypothetical protein HYZ36_06595 [Pedosphaera parvula]|nr:hypothetical protein [Verrucomicrobiota bacterium]MBI3192316.1 hypothetical protein [Pedosphaera parvula]
MPDDKNIDVLQNLEFAIVTTWRQHPEMTDYTALRAYEAALAHYKALARGQEPKSVTLTGLDATAHKALIEMCEFRLGRGAGAVQGPPDVEPIPVAQLVECLQKLRKSVGRWNRVGGSQGYLTFVAQFVR